MKAHFFEENKIIVIDSLTSEKSSIRYIKAPFFTRVKTLIQYALESKDSMFIEMKDMGESIYVGFTIYDTIAEVIGSRIIYFPSLYGSSKGEVSKYELWIHKSDGLPYHFKREMPHDISVELIEDVTLNHSTGTDFKASDYFPSNFSIRNYEERKRQTNDNFEGKIAFNWELMDSENNSLSLKNLKSKVIMLQFTGVSCGACVASIPFLNQLEIEYDKTDFDFVSIECWSKSSHALLKYKERNHINYTFIRSTPEVSKRYQIEGVPVFFILDEKRVIRKVIRGYSKGSVDKQIRDAINELL